MQHRRPPSSVATTSSAVAPLPWLVVRSLPLRSQDGNHWGWEVSSMPHLTFWPLWVQYPGTRSALHFAILGAFGVCVRVQNEEACDWFLLKLRICEDIHIWRCWQQSRSNKMAHRCYEQRGTCKPNLIPWFFFLFVLFLQPIRVM